MILKNIPNFGEMEVITFIRTLDYKTSSLAALTNDLAENGYLNINGSSYTEEEVEGVNKTINRNQYFIYTRGIWILWNK